VVLTSLIRIRLSLFLVDSSAESFFFSIFRLTKQKTASLTTSNPSHLDISTVAFPNISNANKPCIAQMYGCFQPVKRKSCIIYNHFWTQSGFFGIRKGIYVRSFHKFGSLLTGFWFRGLRREEVGCRTLLLRAICNLVRLSSFR